MTANRLALPLFASLLLAGCSGGQKPGAGTDPTCPGGVCAEICDDGLDNDGDSYADCNDTDCADFCDADLDDDGFDDVALGGSDCDDSNPAINPGELEVCDGLDNDCDGLVDDDDDDVDEASQTAWRRDQDMDGYGENGGPVVRACVGPVGAVDNDEDCDDLDPDLNRDDVDNDGASSCDGDCDDNDALLNLQDLDFDGEDTCRGDCNDADPQLNGLDVDLDGQSTCDGDCNDLDPTIETLDQDGDGLTTCAGDCNDEDPNLDLADTDGDGLTSCDGDCDDDDPALNQNDADGDGLTTCGGDCDDTDPLVGNQPDGDGDGFTVCQGDCDDTNPLIGPFDNDLDGYSSCAGDCDDTDPVLSPGDPDGDGVSGCDGDCAVNDPNTYPGAFEIPGDCTDNDCDGATGDIGCADFLYTVRTSDDVVRRLDLTTLTFTDIGPLGTAFDFGELAYDQATGEMFMVDGRGVEGLHTVDLNTGAATLVGIHAVSDMFGLVVDPMSGTLYGTCRTPHCLYSLDRATGAATFIGTPSQEADGLAWDTLNDRMVALAGGGGDLGEIDPLTGTTTFIANSGGVNNCGLAYDAQRDLYWAIDWSGNLYSYDPNAGYARTQVLTGLGAHDGLTFGP